MYGRIFVISTNGAIMRHIIIKIFHHPEVKMIPDNKNTLIKKIKSASHAELISLADDLRKRITETVSESGGHLASNLGMVEATIALHRVFDSPSDNGNQACGKRQLHRCNRRRRSTHERNGL